jgi:lipopolysaccharide export system permease protein
VNKLDWYIIKNFLGTFVYTLLILLSISVIIDISERMDDFIDNDASLWLIIFDYYVNFVIFIGNFLSPFFIFIAVIYFTSRLAYRSEFIAMLGNGISFNRLLRPYLVAAAFLTVCLLLASHWIVPMANKVRIDFENVYIKNPYVNTNRHIHLQITDDQYIYMYNWNSNDSTGSKFALEVIRDGKLVEKLRADKIAWLPKVGKWRITNYYSRANYSTVENIRQGRWIDTTLNFSPADFSRRNSVKETLTTPKLIEFIESERMKGSAKMRFYEVEKHRRTSVPFSTFILTLMGMFIASRKVRGGTGLHLAAGIGLSASYVLFMQLSSTLSTNAGLSPMLGVWVPNIIYAGLCIILYRFAAK